MMSTERNENQKTDERLALEKRITEEASLYIKEIRRLANYEIISHNNPKYILACLRMLGWQFCMQPSKNNFYSSMNSFYSRKNHINEGEFEIKFSLDYINELIRDVESALKNFIEKNESYFNNDSWRKLQDEFNNSRIQCEGLIRHLSLQDQDESKIRENHIRNEEEIRSEYRRR